MFLLNQYAKAVQKVNLVMCLKGSFDPVMFSVFSPQDHASRLKLSDT